MREAAGMSAFTNEERKSFLFRKHIKEKAFEFFLIFLKNIILTEIVVWAVGSDRFLLGLILALGYSLVRLISELINYRKEWLDVDIKDGSDGE